jgi:hypothetical protein
VELQLHWTIHLHIGYRKNTVFIYTESFKAEFCAADWTASSVALQQLVSSAPRPTGRDSFDSCDWQVPQRERCHMSLPSTAPMSSFIDSKIGIHFKPNVLYNTVPHMFRCNCHHLDSGQAHINNTYVVESHQTDFSFTTQGCRIYASSTPGKCVNKHNSFIRTISNCWIYLALFYIQSPQGPQVNLKIPLEICHTNHNSPNIIFCLLRKRPLALSPSVKTRRLLSTLRFLLTDYFFLKLNMFRHFSSRNLYRSGMAFSNEDNCKVDKSSSHFYLLYGLNLKLHGQP